MIQLRYSDGEAEISGNSEALLLLARSIRDLLISDHAEASVTAATDFSPAPYEFAPASIRLVKANHLLRTVHRQSELQVSAIPSALALLASNLEALAQGEPHPLSHAHFDAVSWPEAVDESSAELVLSHR